MTTRPIVVVADDYAISEGTSAVLCDLLETGALNATSCLVETDAWPATAPALKALWDQSPAIAVGLHLNLTDPFPRAPGDIPHAAPWRTKAALATHLAQVAPVLARFRRQWALFVTHFGAPPDFIDGHQHVHLFGPARQALFALIAETGFGGWLRQCRTSAARRTPDRLVLDPLSDAFARAARRRHLPLNPGFGGLRRFQPAENLTEIWEQDLCGMAQGGLLMVHPGASGSPAGTDRIDACRRQEADLLNQGALRAILGRLDLRLTPAPRQWPA